MRIDGDFRTCMNLHRILFPICASALFASPLHAAATPAMKAKASQALRTVPHVDLARYMGDWRVIANIPYFAEKGCVDSIEGYRLRPDGKIANTFTYRKKSFDAPQKQLHAEARVFDKKTNAEWRVTFFKIIRTKYLIVDLDTEYRWTVVGHPSRNYGWIMAREKTLPDATYAAILKRLTAQGYDPAKFAKVPQLPAQLAASAAH